MSEEWLRAVTGNDEVEEVAPGVWKHTFTPPYWTMSDVTNLLHSEPSSDAGQLTLADIHALLDGMADHANAHPDYIYVSVEDARSMRYWYRIGRLFRALPVPRYKLRKCHMRKLQARWRKGKAHIRRVEQAERTREEEAMRHEQAHH